MIQAWIQAARLRTLPLALASMLMGCVMAAIHNAFDVKIALLTMLTAILLQILSNFANDYGDSIHGADHHERIGPKRTVQEGKITPTQMKKAMVLLAILSFLSGLVLLFTAIDFSEWKTILFFVGLGIFCIAGAILYTAGKRPYGYMGLGDVAVLIFFGWVAVGGTYFLQTQTFSFDILLPATSCGLFAVGVLNLNNIRDIDSDARAGKNSIPVRLGKQKAKVYHLLLILTGWITAVIYLFLTYQTFFNFLFLVTLPLFVFNVVQVFKRENQALDPLLRQLALSSLLFVIFFGLSFLFIP